MDGSDPGEATYSVMIRPGEEILVANRWRFRVPDVVRFDEEDELLFVRLVRLVAVEPRAVAVELIGGELDCLAAAALAQKAVLVARFVAAE